MATRTKDQEGLQKINVKIPLDAPNDFDYDVILAVFGRWRLEEGEEIIDLADYLHVPGGPGCILVSHRWHFGIDFGDDQPGLFFSSRKGLKGKTAQRIARVVYDSLAKGKRLLSENAIPETISPRLGELEIAINDRVAAPNTDATDAVVRPGLTTVLDRLYGKGKYVVERDKNPRHRLGYVVKAEATEGLTFDELTFRLSGK